MRLRSICDLLYVIGWIWRTPSTRSDEGLQFHDRLHHQISHHWVFSYGTISEIGASRRRNYTDGLSCSSAYRLYFDGH
ncbi:hypothetical protein TNCV_1116761 [Trichonephila clavipes]|nr:hypothetical protein TNCV_1116761 [Trichonephila clavipes]